MTIKECKKFRPYLTYRKGEVYFNYYPSKDSLLVSVMLDKDDLNYDAKEYLKLMYHEWNKEVNWSNDSELKEKEYNSLAGVNADVFWGGGTGYSFVVTSQVFERLLSKRAGARWKKKNFYLPFSKKLLYNLSGKAETKESSSVHDEALRNMRILEKIAADTHSLEPFIDWLDEFRRYRWGSGSEISIGARKNNSSPIRISRDKAFQIFKRNVEVIQNGDK